MAQQPTQQPAYSYPAAASEPQQQAYNYAPQQYQAQPAYQPQQGAYAQPQQYAPQAQPGYSYPPQQGGYYQSNPDEVRTLFITGFPTDVRDRELANLMRFLPGYEASQLNWKGDFAQGFALFHNAGHAYSAMQLVNNLEFDSRSALRCEMARKNMYIKGAEEGAKRPRTDAYSQQYGGGQNYYGSSGGSNAAAAVAPVSYAQVSNTKDNPPCSTLFVGNMGDQVSEQELMQLFSSQPRFVTLKLVRNARTSTAFVEYADLAAAMAVHDSQQGAILQSSDRGGIRIQYSKNPFGKKRDHAGNPVDPSTLPGPAPRGFNNGTGFQNPEFAAPGTMPSNQPFTPQPEGGFGGETRIEGVKTEAAPGEEAPGT